MHFLVCIAGLPNDAVEKVNSISPARFTGDKNNLPIVRRMNPPFEYRQGMSDYFHEELARRITEFGPDAEVSVALAYVNYSRSTANFVQRFFPFALAAPLDPVYLDAVATNTRKSALSELVAKVELVVRDLRDRIAIVRDTLSGQNFSPLTLPVRNFRSEQLTSTLDHLFRDLGTTDDVRAIIQQGRRLIEEYHPLSRSQERLPYFEDDRGLRFKSPGGALHGVSRRVAGDHQPTCLINSRTRLGGPLKAKFHYDCDYKRRPLDDAYPNCHGTAVPPAQPTHVNISPNDAIR